MVVVVGKSRARVSDLSRGWGRGSEWSVAVNWVDIVAAVSGGKGSGSEWDGEVELAHLFDMDGEKVVSSSFLLGCLRRRVARPSSSRSLIEELNTYPEGFTWRGGRACDAKRHRGKRCVCVRAARPCHALRAASLHLLRCRGVVADQDFDYTQRLPHSTRRTEKEMSQSYTYRHANCF